MTDLIFCPTCDAELERDLFGELYCPDCDWRFTDVQPKVNQYTYTDKHQRVSLEREQTARDLDRWNRSAGKGA